MDSVKISEQAEKETSWTLEDHAKPLLSTDGGAKVDDFVLDSVQVVEDEAKVESKKGHDVLVDKVMEVSRILMA